MVADGPTLLHAPDEHQSDKARQSITNDCLDGVRLHNEPLSEEDSADCTDRRHHRQDACELVLPRQIAEITAHLVDNEKMKFTVSQFLWVEFEWIPGS